MPLALAKLWREERVRRKTERRGRGERAEGERERRRKRKRKQNGEGEREREKRRGDGSCLVQEEKGSYKMSIGKRVHCYHAT